MAYADPASLCLVAIVSFATAAVTLALFARLAAGRQAAAPAAGAGGGDDAIAFLFDDDRLLDATPGGRALLAAAGVAESDWAQLADLLRCRFPGFDAAMAGLAARGSVVLPAGDGTGDEVRARWLDGLARVALVAAEGGASPEVDRQSLAATDAELALLRAAVRSGPAAIWRQDRDGTIVWANDVYFRVACAVLGTDEAYSWPPPVLFRLAPPAETSGAHATVRLPVALAADGAVHWFDCHAYPAGDMTLHFAVPADGVVRAEEALREFVQTLSKTFADLPIGLAIFDRARRLVLFNPALTDLTSVEVEFLAARPTLFAFLDRLRERRRIPEPRDYGSWRARMTDLEAAAAGGFVQENWSLPAGQTFRVTGRPHPDGALAFLIEDISAEISLTRRFRAELELGQAVADSLDEAIAVFSPAGVISFSNAAYAALWGTDPTARLAETPVAEATRLWQARSLPSPVWGDVRDFLATGGERAGWGAMVQLNDGRRLRCRFLPLSGGATLAGFRDEETAAAARPERPPRQESAARLAV